MIGYVGSTNLGAPPNWLQCLLGIGVLGGRGDAALHLIVLGNNETIFVLIVNKFNTTKYLNLIEKSNVV